MQTFEQYECHTM